MAELKDIRRLGRAALTALCIGAAVGAVTAGPLGGVAQAKNGGDHGGNGHGGGNGNGGGNGHSLDHSQSQQHGPSGDAGPGSGTDDGDTSTTAGSDDDSMSPHGLGKLNGFFHASPQALANASPSSSIGRISKTFAGALAAYDEAQVAAQQSPDGTTTSDGTTPTGPTLSDLGAILAGATNKTVTAGQVKAIVDRLAEANPTDSALGDFAANATTEDCQKIADAANAAHAGSTTSTDDTSTDDTSTGDTSSGDTTVTTTTTTTASE